MLVLQKASSLTLTLASASMLLLAAGACSDRQSPTGLQAPAARSADVIGSDIAYGALDYNLTSFDISTLALSATTNLVPPNPIVPPNPVVPPNPIRAFTATFASDTRFELARLDLFQVGDPYCPGLAANYNASINIATSDGGAFYGLISQMAASHCNARVLVDLSTATIRSFQPVP